jgi:mannose/fructose/N-acetylgalactosamine-specific phosphotransferase system component IIC
MGRKLMPLAGILAVVMVLGSFLVAGDPPDVDAPVGEVVEFYADSDSEQQSSALMLIWGAILFMLFATSLRSALRRAESDSGGVSALSYAGAIIFTVGLTLFAAIAFALGDAADNLEPAAVQTLHVMNEDFFFPAAAGVGTFLLGTGIALVKTAVMPKWLGWIAIGFGLLAFTPVGFVSLAVLGLLVIVLAVMLAMRPGDDVADRPNEGATAPPA